ncbi:hypothetical protein [Rhodosalinus sediminis]|uniref:hypothetical protein n=1 Tax=Rhodosalinus sediminis TaxID=1940533 RepID=UPI0023534DED|nr:hypothetical protein [Rhodosalinus sediminis]
MVEIADIEDENSLEAWLKNQPRETAVWIASRAAARVLPVWWHAVLTEDWARERGMTALPVLRSLVISSVAATGPTEEIKHAAASARAAADADFRDADAAFRAVAAPHARAADAAFRAADAAAASSVFTAAYAADSAITAAATARAPRVRAARAAAFAAPAAAWQAVRTDCATLAAGESLARTPLWPDRANPLQERWDAVTARLRDDPPPGGPWDFWRDWYQGLLDGTPMDPDLLTRIALIDPEHWDAGPERVNPMIHEMWTSHGDRVPRSAQPVKAIQQAVAANLDALPLELDALWQLLHDEEERIRGSNTLDPDEKARLLDFLGKMRSGIETLHRTLPKSGAPPDADAVTMGELLSRHARLMRQWLNDNAAENVDSTCRIALIGATTGLFTSMGVPALAAVGIGGLAYGGGKLGDLRDALRGERDERDG